MINDRDILGMHGFDGDDADRIMSRAHESGHEEPILEALKQPVSAPDMSDQIMHQLGYRHVGAQQRRRQVLMRWAGRIGATCVVAIAVKFGIQAFESSPNARRPVGPTMTEALQNDLTTPIKFERPRFRVPDGFAPINQRTVPVSAPARAVGPYKWV